ncbi:MAG: hypothetical protein JWM96_16 [Alphaproteobacteria bacterium]|nr:hypothetical protein [Alphaproteobacteria bacterium]
MTTRMTAYRLDTEATPEQNWAQATKEFQERTIDFVSPELLRPVSLRAETADYLTGILVVPYNVVLYHSPADKVFSPARPFLHRETLLAAFAENAVLPDKADILLAVMQEHAKTDAGFTHAADGTDLDGYEAREILTSISRANNRVEIDPGNPRLCPPSLVRRHELMQSGAFFAADIRQTLQQHFADKAAQFRAESKMADKAPGRLTQLTRMLRLGNLWHSGPNIS